MKWVIHSTRMAHRVPEYTCSSKKEQTPFVRSLEAPPKRGSFYQVLGEGYSFRRAVPSMNKATI